jgi:small subunit ribosomal protein S6
MVTGGGPAAPAIVGARPYLGGFFMPEHARLYDLMLVLSTTAEDDRRAKIVSDVESQITSGGGAVERKDDWNRRPLTFEINHQTEGEYHLFQFTGPTALLETLSHNLRIDDAVLRFRIIKVVPGTPPPPDSPPPVLAGAPTAGPAAADIER